MPEQQAKRIDANTSTVSREVKAHRTIRAKKASPADKAPAKRARYASRRARGTACAKCSTKFTNCKRCKTRRHRLSRPNFELRMREETEKWPYVCPRGYPKRGWCSLSKCSYDAGGKYLMKANI